MAIQEVYATPAEFAQWWGYWQEAIDLDDPECVAQIQAQLKIAAGRINAALNTSGSATCQFFDGADAYLKLLNIQGAAIVYRSPVGPKFEPADTTTWLNDFNEQLRLIRDGEIELCAGVTGKAFPAFGAIEFSWTEFNLRDLYIKKALEE